MEEAKITISEVTGDRIDNVAKLNIIKTEELAIQGELEEKNKISAELANEKSNIKVTGILYIINVFTIFYLITVH